jgi:hypothetical protein
MGLELTDQNLEPVLDILGNTEAIGVNQAWAGHPGKLLESETVPALSATDDASAKSPPSPSPLLNMRQMWAKPLPSGELAVLLINASPMPLAAGSKNLNFSALNLTSTSVTVRDIWLHRGLGVFHGVWPVPTVPPFDSVFVRLAPATMKTDDNTASPPLLSRRALALAPTAFELTVGGGGGLSLVIGGVRFDVLSSFSEVGPHWNNLSISQSGGGGSNGWASAAPTVDRSGAAEGRWVVKAVARKFTLTRVIQLDPPISGDPYGSVRAKMRTDKLVRAHRLLVNDTLTNTAAAIIGMSLKHQAFLQSGTVEHVVVPGILNPGMCGTEDNPGNFCGPGPCDRDSHRMNSARPDVWVNATVTKAHSSSPSSLSSSAATASGSLGMVALDDVFRTHAETRNYAVPQLNPRVHSNCAVSSPPSIQLSDPILALGVGTSHTHEWALYPSDNCTDFFCFVNVLRRDYKTDESEFN